MLFKINKHNEFEKKPTKNQHLRELLLKYAKMCH